MGWAALIGGLIVLGIAGAMVWGAFAPSASVAATYLKKSLESCGIDRAALPEACIKELAAFTVKTIQFEIATGLKKGPVNSFVEEEAAGVAMWVSGIVTGTEPYTAEEIAAGVANDTADPVWEILAKHDPRRFSLDNLEKTQWASAVLRGA